MNTREREIATLTFKKPFERGSVEETFYPWHLTVNRWMGEGHIKIKEVENKVNNPYLDSNMAENINILERDIGFDSVRRVSFGLPFNNIETKVIEDNDSYTIKVDSSGWTRKYYKDSGLVQEVKPAVSKMEDWEKIKEHARKEIEKYYSDEDIKKVYGAYREDHQKGNCSIRMHIIGFFWAPRVLLGIEEHLFAYYDEPEMLHDINKFILDLYLEKLGKVLDILPADVLYIMEDLSGTNGPMLSPDLFDEFVGYYYKQLVPFLKEKGVINIFVDTDGDFNKLIPNFIEAGIEGFLPMDVNAGMDIVAVRKRYPKLKFIGAFNKLEIEKGKEAIDKEFERILPVIRQGGYIPGADHQVTPYTSFENYLYYVKRLKEVMKESGLDLASETKK